MIFAQFLQFGKYKKCVFDWQGRQNMHCREKSNILSRGSFGTRFSPFFESILEPKSWKMPSGKVPKKTSIFEVPFFRPLVDFYQFLTHFQFPGRHQNPPNSHPNGIGISLEALFWLFYDFLSFFIDFWPIFIHFCVTFWLFFLSNRMLFWCLPTVGPLWLRYLSYNYVDQLLMFFD